MSLMGPISPIIHISPISLIGPISPMSLFFRTTCGLYFPKPLPLYPQHGSSPETVIYSSLKKYMSLKKYFAQNSLFTLRPKQLFTIHSKNTSLKKHFTQNIPFK